MFYFSLKFFLYERGVRTLVPNCSDFAAQKTVGSFGEVVNLTSGGELVLASLQMTEGVAVEARHAAERSGMYRTAPHDA